MGLRWLDLEKEARACLVVRKAVQKTPGLDELDVEYQVSVTASGCRGHNILVERKRDEADDDEKIHDRTDRAHSLWSVNAKQQSASEGRVFLSAPNAPEGG